MRDDYFMNAIDDHESFKSGYLNNISYFVTSTVFPDGHVKDVVETCGGKGDVTQIEYPSKNVSKPTLTSSMAQISPDRKINRDGMTSHNSRPKEWNWNGYVTRL